MAGVVWADGETGEVLRILRGGEPVDPVAPPAPGAVALGIDPASNSDLLADLIAAPGRYRLRGGRLERDGQPVDLVPGIADRRRQARVALDGLNPGSAATLQQLRGQLATLIEVVRLLLAEGEG